MTALRSLSVPFDGHSGSGVSWLNERVGGALGSSDSCSSQTSDQIFGGSGERATYHKLTGLTASGNRVVVENQ